MNKSQCPTAKKLNCDCRGCPASEGLPVTAADCTWHCPIWVALKAQGK